MGQLKTSFLCAVKSPASSASSIPRAGLHKCFNGNLLYHGIPMDDRENSSRSQFGGRTLSGKALMDWCETAARQGYYAREGTPERQFGKDFLWFLWCGRNSPFAATISQQFERRLIADQATRPSQKPYYSFYNEDAVCVRILAAGGRALPYRQRPCAGQDQGRRKPDQGGRPPDRDRRRLLPRVPAHHRHRGLYAGIRFPGHPHHGTRAVSVQTQRHSGQ